MIKGIVTKISKNKINVLSNEKTFICKMRGKVKFNQNNLLLTVGDFIEFEKINDDYIISKILERKNYIIRPRVSNIDTVIVVQSIVQPNFNFHLLMQFLAYYEYFVDSVILLFTKYDISPEKSIRDFEIYNEIFKNDGYKTFILNNETDYFKFQECLKDKTFILAGNSGVGKSTLINKLFPTLNIKTQEISTALNRGKHTTTTSQLIVEKDFSIVDTPGFSSIDINLLTPYQLASSYHDFKKLHVMCKYSNCLHQNENNCAIKNAVEAGTIHKERYNMYRQILNEILNKNKKIS